MVIGDSPPATPAGGAGLKQRRSGAWHSCVRWIDSWAEDERDMTRDPNELDWVRAVPFVLLHLACLFVLVVGWSWIALGVAVGYYALRMFAITAFYHRYFSHRAFQTSRGVQFLFALLGSSAIQRGPLWWASHHRAHHKFADQEIGDLHSPVHKGFWWSHVGWILSRGSFRPRFELISDWIRFPELRFLDRFDVVVPLLSLIGFYCLGEMALGMGFVTSGAQMVVWAFCISTVVTYHITFSINSVAHRSGSRSYDTDDDSRNNMLLSLLTFGEGWHNNHHRYPASARQGFRWWQLDLSYYVLRLMAAVGLIWRLNPVPERVIQEAKGR
jgi:stearoyl-CoA desaturase (delta-9 desaturase)